MSDEGLDSWPDDDEMSEMCGCGHSLGQHHYGDQMAPCHECTTCRDFHSPWACVARGCDHD